MQLRHRTSPEALIDVPTAFDPQDIQDGSVLGRWVGESDVNFVRVYDVRFTDARAPTPSWLTAPPVAEVQAAPDQAEFMDRIKTALRAMARAQEIHYSQAMTYTSALDSLEWERPADIGVDVVAADTRGWAGVFTHEALGRICGLGYGAAVPAGWAMGGVVCGPAIDRNPEGN